MAIRRRPRHHLPSLVADLGAEDEVRRETAVTRLSLLGVPAVEPLLRVVTREKSATARAAALQALELIGATHVLAAAVQCLNDRDPVVALAALEVMGRLVRSPQEDEALGHIATIALDASRDERLRLGALRVLAELPRTIVEPLWRQLAEDPNPTIRSYVNTLPFVLPRLADLATFSSIDSPPMARELIAAQAASAPLPVLHRFLDHLRAREDGESHQGRRTDWMLARATLHQALASRGSRVALYDLRETIETADSSLPGAFLAAAATIGDASCLEGLAAAYARAARAEGRDETWWRKQVATTFLEIVRRKRPSTRHPAIRKIATRWPDAAEALLGRKGRR